MLPIRPSRPKAIAALLTLLGLLTGLAPPFALSFPLPGTLPATLPAMLPATLPVTLPAMLGAAQRFGPASGPALAGSERPLWTRTVWTWPLTGVPTLTRPFAPPPHQWLPGHRGVDLAGTEGQPVLAAGAGVVVYAGPLAGRGVVSVDHASGLRTTYEPVRASVLSGQPVAPGQPLGMLAAGHAGCPVAACLHWGLRRGETYLDPLVLMRPPRLRLKPMSARRSTPPHAAVRAGRRPTGHSPRAGCTPDQTPADTLGCARRRPRPRSRGRLRSAF
jgi:murein DD-endopeptidase MepM/ murein hydrolase activator NlpD